MVPGITKLASYQLGILSTYTGQTYFHTSDIPEDAAIRYVTAAIDAITLPLFFF